MIERNATQATMITNAADVLESLRIDICQEVKSCNDCPLGRLYDTLDTKICEDLHRTAGKLMLSRRVVQTL